jgi:preprotein translocase subunit SecE
VNKVTTQAVQTENRLVRYLKETRAELRRVTWPTREQAINLTLIVLAVTIAMAVFLGACDLLFATIMQAILS